MPVIPNPSKIICVGLNYHEHVKETEKTIADNPVTFQRFNDSQVAHMENMIIPNITCTSKIRIVENVEIHNVLVGLYGPTKTL